MDHDDFANIEWQNSQRGNSRSDDESEGGDADLDRHTHIHAHAGETQAGSNADATDLAGVGDGVLECFVGTPIKENDGTKDVFVSYLVTTHVSLSSLNGMGK